MSTKLALILLGVWTLLVIAGCSGAIWFVTAKVPRHQQDERAKMLGGGMATVALIGYAAILLPWAVAWGKKRRRQRDEEEQDDRADRDQRSRRRNRKRADDDSE